MKISLDLILFFNYLPDSVYLLLVQIFCPFIGVYLGLFDYFSCGRQANAVNIRQRILDFFVVGNINSCDSHHKKALGTQALASC